MRYLFTLAVLCACTIGDPGSDDSAVAVASIVASAVVTIFVIWVFFVRESGD